MKITVEEFQEIENKISVLEKAVNGGKGSGNFGHAGRPGKVGGSGKSGTAISQESTQKDSRVYEQAAYEQAAREYESEMGSLNSQIGQYEKNNRVLQGTRAAAEMIKENNRRIEDLREQGRVAIARMAAKSAQYHYGVGEITKETVGWSIKLGDTTKVYLREKDAKIFQEGAKGSYKLSATAETEVHKGSDGKYDVVYKGTDLGIGYTTGDRMNAHHYMDGWNAATKITNEIRDNLLKSMPRYAMSESK